MKNTAAFLVLLWCLTGSALGENQPTTEQQGCPAQGTTTSQGDPSAPQNQIEYGGGG